MSDAARAHPAVALAVALATGAAALQLVATLTTAPATWDSMTYHLSRAAYWLQEGSILPYEGASVRQAASAPNAEIATAWTMAMAGSDRFVGLVQWAALLTSAGAVVAIARQLGATRPAAVFAAAVWAVLPGPILQSSTTQNDLTATALVLVAVAFGLRALRGGGRAADVVPAGVAFGLAIGTKGTVAIALPALGVLAAGALVQLRPPLAVVLRLGAGAAAGAIAFGAFGYVANTVEFGGPGGGLAQLGERVAPPQQNLVRVAWSFVESPGVAVPWVDRVLSHTVQPAAEGWRGDPVPLVVGTQTDQDNVAGGLVALLVLFPILVVVAVRRRTPVLRRAAALAPLVYVVVFATVHVATPYNGRVLLPALGLAAPLLAVAATRPWLRAVTVVLAATSLLPVLLTNTSRPLLPERGQPGVWSMSRDEQQTITRPDQLAVVGAVREAVGDRGRVAFLGGEDSWDYPLFGPHRERHVLRLLPTEVPGEPDRLCSHLLRLFRARQLDAIVFADAPREVPAPPPALRAREPAPGHFVATAQQVGRCRGAAGGGRAGG